MEAKGPLSFLSWAFKLLTFNLWCQRAFSIWVLAACVSILNWLEHQHCLGGKGQSLSWKKPKMGSLMLSVHLCLPRLRGGGVGWGGDFACLPEMTCGPAGSRQPCKARKWTSKLQFSSGICQELALACAGNLHRDNSEEKVRPPFCVPGLLPVVGGPLGICKSCFP